jgi:hypothetical protein
MAKRGRKKSGNKDVFWDDNKTKAIEIYLQTNDERKKNWIFDKVIVRTIKNMAEFQKKTKFFTVTETELKDYVQEISIKIFETLNNNSKNIDPHNFKNLLFIYVKNYFTDQYANKQRFGVKEFVSEDVLYDIPIKDKEIYEFYKDFLEKFEILKDKIYNNNGIYRKTKERSKIVLDRENNHTRFLNAIPQEVEALIKEDNVNINLINSDLFFTYPFSIILPTKRFIFTLSSLINASTS